MFGISETDTGNVVRALYIHPCSKLLSSLHFLFSVLVLLLNRVITVLTIEFHYTFMFFIPTIFYFNNKLI